MRTNRIAGQHVFLDNRGKHCLAARLWLRASGFCWGFRHYEDSNKGVRDSIANYGKWLQLLSLEVSPGASSIRRPGDSARAADDPQSLMLFSLSEARFDACRLGP